MAKVPRSLVGHVVAITGGARGIGAATAAALIARGARVAIGDLDAALAQQTAERLGSETVALPLDVTDRDSFTKFLDEVEGRLGPLDVLINNAGIMPVGPFLQESDATAERLVDINVHGVIFGSKLALERFIPRNRGHLVNIASIVGKMASPHLATYVATKHAVVGLTEALRLELADTDIGLIVVMPVGVNTELYSGVEPLRGIKTPEPEEVAEAIVDLVLDLAKDDRAPAPRDDVQLVPARPGVRVEDPIAAQAVVPGGAALGGTSPRTGRVRRSRRARARHSRAPGTIGGGSARGRAAGRPQNGRA